MPIDYCVILSGPNAGILARVSFNSLIRCADLTDIHFHLINKDISAEDVEIISALSTDYPVTWYKAPQSYPVGPNRTDVPNWVDASSNSNFALTQCGTAKWCILAHFDMTYEKDFLALCKTMLADDVAMLGQHERFLMLNREAYKQSHCKFVSMASYRAVPAWPPPTHGQYQLRSTNDPRASVPEALTIRGFDTGELLELELYSLGWKVYPLLLELREYITHFGGGGSHYNEPEKSMHRERALRLIAERGY